MNNIFSSKSFMARFGPTMSTGPALSPKQKETFDGADGSKPNNKIEGSEVKAAGPPAKRTRAEKRLEKTKEKAKDAKEAAEKTSNDSGITVKGTRQGLKADRLAKRQKRQEGRAERKNIRKKAKEGKIIDGKSGEYNAMSKKEKIKASRKKQNSEGPAKRKGLLRRANKEIARKNTDGKKVQRLVEKYVEKNK